MYDDFEICTTEEDQDEILQKQISISKLHKNQVKNQPFFLWYQNKKKLTTVELRYFNITPSSYYLIGKSIFVIASSYNEKDYFFYCSFTNPNDIDYIHKECYACKNIRKLIKFACITLENYPINKNREYSLTIDYQNFKDSNLYITEEYKICNSKKKYLYFRK